MFKAVKAKHGRLDTVVANAITNANGPLGSISEEQFDRTFNTNAKGVLFSIQPALPLLPRGGTIVIIGSTASINPPPGMSLYGGAKAAVRCMVRSWIQDIKGSGVRINILSAGAVDTPSLRSALDSASGADKVDAAVQSMGEGDPLGRLSGLPRGRESRGVSRERRVKLHHRRGTLCGWRDGAGLRSDLRVTPSRGWPITAQ